MIPLLLGYLVTYPITPLFISLVVCVMFIFLHNNTSSSLHNLLNVLFLDILLVKRAFYVMILTFIEFKSLEMPFSKNFFFLQHIMTLSFFANFYFSIVFQLILYFNHHLNLSWSTKDKVLPLKINQTKPWHVSCPAILQALSQNPNLP